MIEATYYKAFLPDHAPAGAFCLTHLGDACVPHRATAMEFVLPFTPTGLKGPGRAFIGRLHLHECENVRLDIGCPLYSFNYTINAPTIRELIDLSAVGIGFWRLVGGEWVPVGTTPQLENDSCRT